MQQQQQADPGAGARGILQFAMMGSLLLVLAILTSVFQLFWLVALGDVAMATAVNGAIAGVLGYMSWGVSGAAARAFVPPPPPAIEAGAVSSVVVADEA